ncbi:MAG TPA: hypothetical protein VFP72_17230 [Kineosporiaceae bacterium]|nr:hypothetical protein [Kineosporiaceae bacterium]
MATDEELAALATDVERQFASGAAAEEVARWLHTGPASNRPILAIKALRLGSGRSLAECKRLVDNAILDVDPDYFDRVVPALRRDAAEALGLPDEGGHE